MKALVVAVLAAATLIAGGASALARRAPARARSPRAAPAGTSPDRVVFTNQVFANGRDLTHAGGQPVSQPDDITRLGRHIFVGFQNEVGPQGQPNGVGNADSTVVEFDLRGHAVAQWDIVGKCDGLTADPTTGRIIATVNEDANSSLYLIDPGDGAGAGAVHYRYSEPLPSDGGTDAITVYRGIVLVSASAPGTTGAPAPQPTYPAVYRAEFDFQTHVVALHALFYDEASATVANTSGPDHGQSVRLGLTDPDSNEAVPRYAERFPGDFMLTSQGDLEQIFVSDAGEADQALSVLRLSSSVDDTAWPSDSSGALFITDHSHDTIDKLTGPFRRGAVFAVVTPCSANAAPSTCPAPGYPANYVGRLNPYTGVLSPIEVHGTPLAPQGMLFLP